MKRNKIVFYLLMILVGGISFYFGEFVLRAENVKMISSLCIGFGAAIFCLGIGNLIGAVIISKTENEEITRQEKIELNDERNIKIREKVGAKINQVVIYALCIIALAMGFMQVDIVAIVMVVAVLFLELILAITLSNYYSKRM